MSQHRCEQINNIQDHNTEIALLKQSYVWTDHEVNEIKKKLNTNTVLLITSLVSVILALLGIIAIFIEIYYNK